MVFGTDPYLQRAREHLHSEDAHRLLYAALELRLALERVAYQKLQQRLDKITVEEIGAWQPARAIERLMELVDEHLASDAVLRMAPEDSQGNAKPEDFVTLGSNKGIRAKDIGRHWHKLGSFLHAQLPRKKGEQLHRIDESALKRIVEEVIAYVAEVTKTRFDFHFSESVTFTCGKCGQSIVRNSKILKHNDVVQCQNPNCIVSYIAQKTGEEFSFKPYLLDFKCHACGLAGC